MKCIISIELGTNAIRVVAFDLKGMVIGSLKGYCPTFHSEPDSSEQDPDQLFITMLYVLKNLLTDFVYPKKYVVISICFSASMHSVLATDKNGNPIGAAADHHFSAKALKSWGVIFPSVSVSSTGRC